MGTQISLKLPDPLYTSAKKYAASHGYEGIQDLIRELLREKFFGGEAVSGKFTALAAQDALARHWLSSEEDAAWAHLQKGM